MYAQSEGCTMYSDEYCHGIGDGNRNTNNNNNNFNRSVQAGGYDALLNIFVVEPKRCHGETTLSEEEKNCCSFFLLERTKLKNNISLRGNGLSTQ